MLMVQVKAQSDFQPAIIFSFASYERKPVDWWRVATFSAIAIRLVVTLNQLLMDASECKDSPPVYIQDDVSSDSQPVCNPATSSLRV